MTVNLPDEIRICLDTLKNAGIKAYLVGGCVRDMLLNKTPNDYDITVNTSPEHIRSLFPHTYDTGIKHGTITVLINSMPIEITQMRIDGEYTDHRRPTEVIPALNIDDDLKRRDFTVNAMAISQSGELIDNFGGKEDLKNKIIRTVGDARLRYDEDALRIMRAFRFSAVLGFDIEQNSLDSALNMSHLLKEISAERIFAELTKTLMSPHPEKIEPLLKCGALSFLGLNYYMPLSPIGALSLDRDIRTAALFILCNADPLTVCKNLKTDKALRKSTGFLYDKFKSGFDTDEVALKGLIAENGYDLVLKLITLYNSISETDVSHLFSLLEKIKNDPLMISDLDINGNDLLSLNIKPQYISTVLKHLQGEVHKDKNVNHHNILLQLTTKYCKNIPNIVK
ncbi:MAG: hypothetical protein IJF54_02250 [Clostridia bacterium]|nr:hypothetical protein [Clostridia bacterium]